MNFKILPGNFRAVFSGRIAAGEITGLHLAQQTGFKQAHISNSLNKKRGLTREGMDKTPPLQRLDPLDPAEVNKHASVLYPAATVSKTSSSPPRPLPPNKT